MGAPGSLWTSGVPLRCGTARHGAVRREQQGDGECAALEDGGRKTTYDAAHAQAWPFLQEPAKACVGPSMSAGTNGKKQAGQKGLVA